ncbi:MAG: ATP phosphoribosyltransferase [Vampirovibrionales bacterium]
MMMTTPSALSPESPLKLTIPKGRIQEKVLALLGNIGVHFKATSRSYRPSASDPTIQCKIMKAQNIPALIHLGRHDAGFTGLDWIYEQQADVVELLDLRYDPVKIVAAIPEDLLNSAENPFQNKTRQVIVASEYKRCVEDFIAKHQLNAVYLQSYGATEAFPPEDADFIVDNTATGSTLRMNRLAIVDEIMHSTTRFVASKQAMANPAKRAKLEEMAMLMEACMRATKRVLVEMNVATPQFDAVINLLASHAMTTPTVAPLHGQQGYAVKVAVETPLVSLLIPQLVQAGATDILEYKLEKLIP